VAAAVGAAAGAAAAPPPATRTLVVVGCGPATLVAKARLVAVLVARGVGRGGAGVVALGGLLGAAWLAAAPVRAGTRASPLARLAARAGVAAAGGEVWAAAGAVLRAAAAAAEQAGVPVLAPCDLLFSAPRAAAPAVDVRLLALAPAESAAEAAAFAASALHRAARAALRKAVPGAEPDADEAIAEAEGGLGASARAAAAAARATAERADEEDARADEEYDSADSDDMVALLARNTRRRETAPARADALALRGLRAQAAAALRPKLADDRLLAAAAGDALAAVENGGGAAEGVPLPLAGNVDANGDLGWHTPFGVEPARYAHERAPGAVAGDGNEAPRVVALGDAPDADAAWPADAPPPAVYDIGPASLAAILETAEAATAVFVFGTLGAVETPDGDGATADVLAALADAAARGARAVLVGAAAAAFAERIGLAGAGGDAADGGAAALELVPAPGAGVAIVLAAAGGGRAAEGLRALDAAEEGEGASGAGGEE